MREVVKQIDNQSRLVIDTIKDGKAYWVVEENHRGEWKEILRVCENMVEAESVINHYKEMKLRSIYE